MGPGRIALAAGRAGCDVNYSLFWRIVLGCQNVRHLKELAAQKGFDFRFRPLGAPRAVWTSGSSTNGGNRTTA